MARKKKGSDRLAVQNAAKTLLANIRFASVDDPIRSVTVTSSKPNEGKSTVAVNLAQAIATSGASVCLVEADMRRRTLAGMLGVHASGGIYSVLSEDLTLDEAVVETSQKNMFFLDSEPNIPNPADIIASRRFASLVKLLEDRFRYVVFDTPPVGTFVDAAEVGHLSDAAVFVIRENFTKRNEVLEAFEQLRKAEVNVIGTVMNCCESNSGEYYYAYYNARGERVNPSDRAAVNRDLSESLPETARTAQSSKGGAASEDAASGSRFARR